MSKMLDATSDATGKVTAEGVIVSDAQVMSLGKQASAGILLIDKDKARYIPSSATDIQTTIDKLINVLTSLSAGLTTISTSLTSIGAGMTGPTTAPPPTLPADVLTITSKVTELNLIKTELTTLKDTLK